MRVVGMESFTKINKWWGETQQYNMRTRQHIGRNFTINKTKRKLIKYKIKILHLSLDNKIKIIQNTIVKFQFNYLSLLPFTK